MPERYLFPKSARILAKSDYAQAFSRGEKVWGRHFICYASVDAARETRLGLVVSRKVGAAVVRNRVKRHIREFFRHYRHRFQPGLQLVVIARTSSESLSGVECACELERMLGRRLRGA